MQNGAAVSAKRFGKRAERRVHQRKRSACSESAPAVESIEGERRISAGLCGSGVTCLSGAGTHTNVMLTLKSNEASGESGGDVV